MKKLIILLTLVLSFSFANAEKHSGLKAKDYKNVKVIIEDISKSNTGLTNKDVENKVKLTLLKNGFKISNEIGKDFIYVQVYVMAMKDGTNDIYTIDVNYMKFSDNHFDSYKEKESAGSIFKPQQGIYSVFAITYEKSAITDNISSRLESFLVDYIESNIK